MTKIFSVNLTVRNTFDRKCLEAKFELRKTCTLALTKGCRKQGIV